jgi:hypothetical protein
MNGWLGFILMVASLPALGIAALLWGCDSRECSEDWYRRHSWSLTAVGPGGGPGRGSSSPGGPRERIRGALDTAVSAADSPQVTRGRDDRTIPAWSTSGEYGVTRKFSVGG